MRRRLLLAAPALLTLAAEAPPIPTVASFSLLADMLRRIGAGRITVTTLVPVDGDAHGYQPRPADARAVSGAQLVAVNGLGLDHWMDRLIQSSGFKGTVAVATAAVTPRSMAGGTATDPHAWQDPRNGILYARALAAALVAADPSGATGYRAAAEAYVADIQQTDAWIEAQYTAIPAGSRRVITTHDAFGYYGARYGIEFLAAQGLSTEAEPSAKAIAALVAQIRREKVRAVFLENMTNPRLAQMLARETGAVLGGTVYSDALSGPKGPAATYLAMLRHNTGLFAASMRG